jgi:hypothetical protein
MKRLNNPQTAKFSTIGLNMAQCVNFTTLLKRSKLVGKGNY